MSKCCICAYVVQQHTHVFTCDPHTHTPNTNPLHPHTGNPLGTPKLPTSPTKLAKRGRPLKATTSGMRSTTSTPTSSKTQLLEAYKMQLREYKALLEELGPWVRAFEQQSGRKPKLHDVEATRIPWLLEKYKKYVVLRERVMLDTTGLRGMLGGGQAPNNTVARYVFLSRMTTQYKICIQCCAMFLCHHPLTYLHHPPSHTFTTHPHIPSPPTPQYGNVWCSTVGSFLCRSIEEQG